MGSRSSKFYVGVDPDVSGAISVLSIERDHNGFQCSDVEIIDMPFTVKVVNGRNRRCSRIRLTSGIDFA